MLGRRGSESSTINLLTSVNDTHVVKFAIKETLSTCQDIFRGDSVWPRLLRLRSRGKGINLVVQTGMLTWGVGETDIDANSGIA